MKEENIGENILAERETSQYEMFLLLPQWFQKWFAAKA